MRFILGTVCVLDIKNKRNKCTQTLNLVCGSCDGFPVGWLLSAGMKVSFLFNLFSTDRMTWIFSLFSLFNTSIIIKKKLRKTSEKSDFLWKAEFEISVCG